MDAVVSLLPQPYYARVQSIWDDLERVLGLHGYHITPYPHISWQIAKTYDRERLRSTLQELAARQAPLPIRTGGIGIFTGEYPVVYIQVVKTPELLVFHARVWETLQAAGSGISSNSFYAPEQWMPHISLAFLDVTMENIGPLMQRLAFHSYNWMMSIDQFAYLYQPEGEEARLVFSVAFGG